MEQTSTLAAWVTTDGVPMNDTHIDDVISLSIRNLVMRVIYISIATMGLVGNALVVCVLLVFSKMRKKVTNVFIINQSILDFLTALMVLLTTILEYDGRPLHGVADDAYCRVWLGKVPLWSFLFSSTYNLVALTIERYLEVVHPIKHKLHFNKRVAAIMLAVVWLIGPTFNITYDVTTSRVENGRCRLLEVWPDKTTQQVAGLVAVTMQYFIPIALLVFCYVKMALSLHRKLVGVGPRPPAPPAAGLAIPGPGAGPSDGTPPQDPQNAMPGVPRPAGLPRDPKPRFLAPPTSVVLVTTNAHKSILAKGRKNIIKTLGIVSTAFILCLSLNQWFFFLFNLGVLDFTAFDGIFYHCSVVFMFANCCVNPFIYTFQYRDFKLSLRKLFCKRWTANSAVVEASTIHSTA